MSRPSRKPSLVPDPWKVLSEAVESGVAYGVRRADKYADGDTLTEEQAERVREAVYDAVMSEMSERFRWPDYE